jgi:anti-sigma B factor antagonist
MAPRLSAVFDVFKDDQDAINSFFPDRKVQRYDLLKYLQRKQASPNSH